MFRFDPWYRAMRAPRRLFRHLGLGLITGAAGDYPSGIATYSQAGAQFGPAMLWSCLVIPPLLIKMLGGLIFYFLKIYTKN